MKEKCKTKIILCNIVIFVMIFQSLLERIIPIFRWYDEIFALIIFIFAVLGIAHKGIIKKNKYYILIFACIVVYLFLGTVSTYIYQYQSVGISVLGAFLSIKWFLLMAGGYAFYSAFLSLEDLYAIKKGLYIDAILYFLWEILSLSNIFNSAYSIYQWDLCAKSVFIAGIVLLTWQKTKMDYITLLIALFMEIASTKAKGYAAFVLIIICLIWIVYKEKKLSLVEMGLVMTAAIMVAWDKIYFYYIQGSQFDYARYRMFATSIDIARDYFPLGTGWSTYGSYYAAEIYSPVYYLYGIDKHYHLGVARKLFLTDNYWPTVIAENGWLGFFAMLLFILILLVVIQKIYYVNKNAYAVGILVLFYMMVTTFEETGFAQPVLACLGLLMGVVISIADKEKTTQSLYKIEDYRL